MSHSSSQVGINDFEVGQVLPGDIVDENEKVLFRQGLKLTKDILAAWERRGPGPFFLKQSADSPPPAAPSTKTNDAYSFDGAHLQLINDWFVKTSRSYQKLVENVLSDMPPALDGLEASVDELQKVIDQDPDGITYWFSDYELNRAKPEGIAVRSVLLTALVAGLAKAYGLDMEDRKRICLAALLHDMALVPDVTQKIQVSLQNDEERRNVVARHGFCSVDLLNTRNALPEVVRLVMQQVHEQMDGSGYPRGIPGHVINVMARLINIVDAYMTLISAGTSEPGFVPGDAIAYMVYHTSRGAFDREAMMAFIKWQTMYGIGSLVQLDDGRQGITLRPGKSNPLRPVLELIEPNGNETGSILPLESTQLNIEKPIVDKRAFFRVRIVKSELHQVLWQKQLNIESGTPVTV